MGRPRLAARRGQLAKVALVCAVAGLAAGCFDSDQRVRLGNTMTTGPATGGSPPSPWTTGQGASSSSGDKPVPEATCRDAVECVFGCAAGLELPLPPEPDLTCFLECEDGLTEDEALLLLRLLDCVAAQCAEKGLCGAGTTGGSSGTGTSTGAGGGAELDPCTNCILVNVQDPQPPGCLEEAAMCD